MKIYLIRHGETTSDIEDQYGGAYDDHLTERGQLQAKTLGQKLVGKGIEALYVSPKFRTKETAQAVIDELAVPMEIMKDLTERDYGILGGLTKAEALEKHPEAVENHKNYRNTDPEGESYDDFKTRVMNGFNKIVSSSTYQTIGILTHGGPIKMIYRELFKDEIQGSIADCGIMELQYNEGKFIFEGLNKF